MTERVSLEVISWARLLECLRNRATEKAVILSFLSDGGFKSCDELLFALYDGAREPDTSFNLLRVLIYQMRREGVPIERCHGLGYRLRRLDEKPPHPRPVENRTGRRQYPKHPRGSYRYVRVDEHG